MKLLFVTGVAVANDNACNGVQHLCFKQLEMNLLVKKNPKNQYISFSFPHTPKKKKKHSCGYN